MSRILIAEADAAVAARLHEALEGAGHRTEHAADGETALILARAAGFDRIILGANLPLLAGPEVLAQIRSEGVTTPAIVIIAEGSVPAGSREGGQHLTAGATRHLPRSFRVTDVLDLLGRVRRP